MFFLFFALLSCVYSTSGASSNTLEAVVASWLAFKHLELSLAIDEQIEALISADTSD
jgi:hypothetical protein